MNNAKRISPACFLLLFTFVIVCSCDSPIEKYIPQDRDEKEILSVLIQYQDAKNRFDLDTFLSFLHENGEFSYQCGVMVSKAKLKKLLPGYWTEIMSGNSAAFSLVHECINGDSYKSGKLNNLQIEIRNDQAQVTALFTKGFTRVLQYFSMTRENDRWLITRTEWGQS